MMKRKIWVMLFLVMVSVPVSGAAQFHNSRSNALRIYDTDKPLKLLLGGEYWTTFKGYSLGARYAFSNASELGLVVSYFTQSTIETGIGGYYTFPLWRDEARQMGLSGQVSSQYFNLKSGAGLVGVGSLLASKQFDRVLVFLGGHVPLVAETFNAASRFETVAYPVVGAEYYLNKDFSLFTAAYRDIVSLGFTFRGFPVAGKVDIDGRNSGSAAFGFGHPIQLYQFNILE